MGRPRSAWPGWGWGWGTGAARAPKQDRPGPGSSPSGGAGVGCWRDSGGPGGEDCDADARGRRRGAERREGPGGQTLGAGLGRPRRDFSDELRTPRWERLWPGTSLWFSEIRELLIAVDAARVLQSPSPRAARGGRGC